MNKLPRLNVGWDEQPGLFPRYWDTAMTAIEGGSTSTTNEVYIDQYYANSTSTDSDALLAFAAVFNTGSLGDTTLYFAPGKGRGPAGRYIIDQEILFTAGNRLVLDFRESTLRWTTTTSRIHYKAPFVTGSSSVSPTSFFIVRNGVCQYAAAIDCLFYWDFPYIQSYDMGTGYVENLRVVPQDNLNAGHTTVATFRGANTWYWSADRVHAKGPPRTIGNYVSGNSFIRQEGLCIATTITRCELEFYDTAIIPGIANLVGVNGTFGGGGTYTRYKGVQQGAVTATFVRNDSWQGNGQYTLWNETGGSLVPGACTLIATNGLPTPGSFTISSVTRFGQASEAISVSGGTSIISGNYAINATSPAPTTKFLEWNFEDCHINTALGAIKVNGIAALSFGNGMWCTSPGSGITFIDVNNGDGVDIDNFQFTSNDLPNVTIFKGRNITAGRFCNNTLYLIKYAVDLDSTVLDFKVHGNTAYSLTTGNNPAPPTFLYSGNRYNQTSFRGVDFKSNGKLGQGFDTDDNRMLGWFPSVTSQLGSTVTISFFSGQGGVGVDNGVFHLGCSFQITGIGTNATPGTNQMYISVPALTTFGVPASAIPDFAVTCMFGDFPIAARYDSANSRIVINNADPTRNTTSNAFRFNNSAIPVPLNVYITGSCPIQYN